MKILRVFNNNVVLAEEADTELILTGRGLGFQARPGQEVDRSKIARTFVPSDGRDPDHLGELLADIAPEVIQLVATALTDAGLEAESASSPTLVIALADHIGFALRRGELGMRLNYPLLAEVKHLYPDEYRKAGRLLTALNRSLEDPLPDDEAVAIALHLVNAGFSGGDLSYTYTMTGIIQQMIAVIEQAYDCQLDLGSVNVGRLITHLRYLFVRINEHKQLDEPHHSTIGSAIRDAYPEACECAKRLSAVLELRLNASLTEDEVSYLTLHVARVTSGHPEAPTDSPRHERTSP